MERSRGAHYLELISLKTAELESLRISKTIKTCASIDSSVEPEQVNDQIPDA